MIGLSESHRLDGVRVMACLSHEVYTVCNNELVVSLSVYVCVCVCVCVGAGVTGVPFY